MKRARKHDEPSAESLREMPEVDFTKGTWKRNPYAARIAKEGIILPGPGRPKKGQERGSIPRSVRFPANVWSALEAKAKAQGMTLHAALRTAIVEWVSR